ncbi:MAG: 50S ribosomal protein L6 [Endomicrobiales bacterium]|nr:50S ribosomal protein L6 [Endomicrobiales bacterium]
MSRLGKRPLPIPEKVKVEKKDHILRITGPLGTLNQNIPLCINAKIENNQVVFEMTEFSPENNMMHGLTRGLVKNCIEGVVNGFKKELEISGLGYKAALEGNKLNLQLGFSHPVVFPVPEGIKITVEKATRITISGADKTLVGKTAAHIRSFRPPEPYKATGIKYVGEHIIRKAGKAAAAGAMGAK